MNEVARFREAATSLCRLIETADQIQPVEVLRRASGLLAAVYSAAVELPNPNTDASWEGDDLFRVEDWAAIQSTLQAKLDGIDKYRFVFYPDPEVKDEPIVSSISFGLAEIYVDLKQALPPLGQTSRRRAASDPLGCVGRLNRGAPACALPIDVCPSTA